MLIFDIESVRSHEDYKDLSLKGQELVEKLAARDPNTEPQKWWEEKGAFYPEFAKVCCVSFVKVEIDAAVVASFYGSNEQALLYDVALQLKKYAQSQLVGFNIKNFDIPFLCKRFLANGIAIPQTLDLRDLSGNFKKPWEVPHMDLMDIWKFGSYNMAASLDMACYALGIQSPKGELDGSKVAGAYFAGEYDKIASYCEDDTVSTYHVACKLNSGTPKPFNQLPIRKKF